VPGSISNPRYPQEEQATDGNHDQRREQRINGNINGKKSAHLSLSLQSAPCVNVEVHTNRRRLRLQDYRDLNASGLVEICDPHALDNPCGGDNSPCRFVALNLVGRTDHRLLESNMSSTPRPSSPYEHLRFAAALPPEREAAA